MPISSCTKILSRKKYMTLNIKLKLWIIRRQIYDKFLTHNEIINYLPISNEYNFKLKAKVKISSEMKNIY